MFYSNPESDGVFLNFRLFMTGEKIRYIVFKRQVLGELSFFQTRGTSSNAASIEWLTILAVP